MKNISNPSETSDDDEMKLSVAQGLAYLATNHDVIEFKLKNGGWNFAQENTAAANALEQAINMGIGHSGTSFGMALKRVFREAVDVLGYVADVRASTNENSSDVIATLRPPAP